LDTLREAVPIWTGDKNQQQDGGNGECVVLTPPSTLPARCVEALTSLIKLWDARTEECKAREAQKAANKSNTQAGDTPMKDADTSTATASGARPSGQPDDERDELESDTEDVPSHTAKASRDPTVARDGPQPLNINDSGKPSQKQRTSSTGLTAVPNDTSSSITTLEPLDPTTSLSGLGLSVFENAPSFLDTQMLLDPNFACVLDPQYMGQNTSSFGY